MGYTKDRVFKQNSLVDSRLMEKCYDDDNSEGDGLTLKLTLIHNK